MTNPSAETNLTSWSGSQLAAASLSTTRAWVGTQSVAVTFPAATGGVGPNASLAGITTTGVVHLVTGALRLFIPTGVTVPQIYFRITYTSGGADDLILGPFSGTNAWTTVVFPARTTDAARTLSGMQIFVYNPSAVASGTFWIDGVDLRIDEPDADSYIDGDQPNCTWSGTAHASTSTRAAVNDPHVVAPSRRGGLNLITNPSIETNTTGWTPQVGAVISRSTEAAWVGTSALKLVSSGATNSNIFRTLSLTGITTTGDTHVLFAAVRIWLAAGVTIPRVMLRVGYSEGGTTDAIISDLPGTSDWQTVSLGPVVSDPTKTINSIQLYPIWQSTAAPSAFVCYFDGMDVRIDEPDIDDYIDGSLGSRYSWSGTAHASTSVRAAVVAPYVPPTPLRPGVNRVPNPSAETSLTGIGAGAGIGVVQSSDIAWVGSSAVRALYPAGTAANVYVQMNLTGVTLTGVAHTVSAAVRLWMAAGQLGIRVGLRVDYASGGGQTINWVDPVGTGTWQEVIPEALIIDQTKTIQAIYLVVQGAGATLAAAAVLYIDAWDLRLDEPDAAAYIDGSLGTYYGWTGTAHASTSYYYAPITGNVTTTSRLQPLNPDGVWHSGSGVFEASITRPADLAPTVLPLNGVNVAWKVSGQSTLSAEIETETLLETFGSIDLRAYWLRWQHPTLGVWTGEITECEADLSTGTTELGATDFSNLLDSRRIAKVYDVQSATAGALFKRVIVDAQREADGYSWIRQINADETGDPLKWQARGGTVLDAITNLESNSQEEWWVDENRIAWWARRRGSNKTGSVQLVDGLHIVGGRYSVALRPLVNDLRVIPADETYAVSQSFALDDDVSIKRFGRRQDQLTYTVGVTKATLLPVATRDLARLSKLGDTIQIDVADVALNDQISAFAAIRDGDSILLLLPSLNRAMQVRVLARSYDSDSDLLRLSADVEG